MKAILADMKSCRLARGVGNEKRWIAKSDEILYNYVWIMWWSSSVSSVVDMAQSKREQFDQLRQRMINSETPMSPSDIVEQLRPYLIDENIIDDAQKLVQDLVQEQEYHEQISATAQDEENAARAEREAELLHVMEEACNLHANIVEFMKKTEQHRANTARLRSMYRLWQDLWNEGYVK